MSSHYPDRRSNNKDALKLLLTWSNAIAVLSLFFAVFLLAAAKPEKKNFFDHFFNINAYRRSGWDMAYIDYIGILLVVSLTASVAGLLINQLRRKRRGDHIHSTLVISLVLSIAGLVLYFRAF